MPSRLQVYVAVVLPSAVCCLNYCLRYLNPLLSAYDQRLSAALAELSAKTDAVRDIQDKVSVTTTVLLHVHGSCLVGYL